MIILWSAVRTVSSIVILAASIWVLVNFGPVIVDISVPLAFVFALAGMLIGPTLIVLMWKIKISPRTPRARPVFRPPSSSNFGTYNGYPVQYIGPARFPDCRRPSCVNTCEHAPGEGGCIG